MKDTLSSARRPTPAIEGSYHLCVPVRFGVIPLATVVVMIISGCVSQPPAGASAGSSSSASGSGPGSLAAPTVTPTTTPTTTPATSPGTVVAAPPGPAPGNPNGHASVPAEAQAVDTSHPNRVIGAGSAASCTSEAVVAAVAAGGLITFDCGANPMTIVMKATAKVRNATGPRIVLDGGGKVTLSGGGQRRILYMNTCDKAQGWTTSHCQDQTDPQLTVQNLSFVDGNSTGDMTEGGGGGAIFVRGGRLKVVNSRFLRNRCDQTGPDLGGAAIRIMIQYHSLPNYVVNSTFGGAAGQGGSCSNGGAISGLHVSLALYNSLLTHNSAIGRGANPAKDGLPGGGSGGAVYTDGDHFTVGIYGCVIEDNHAKEGGGAIFMVSNDGTGTMSIDASTLRRNPNDVFDTTGLPGIFFLGAGKPKITASTVK
jgi:hypothetical protein